MNQISCIIVDDEPLSQDVIRDFVNEIPWLKLNGVCFNALEAMEILHHTPSREHRGVRHEKEEEPAESSYSAKVGRGVDSGRG